MLSGEKSEKIASCAGLWAVDTPVALSSRPVGTEGSRRTVLGRSARNIGRLGPSNVPSYWVGSRISRDR